IGATSWRRCRPGRLLSWFVWLTSSNSRRRNSARSHLRIRSAQSAQSPVLFDYHLRRSSCPLKSDCAVLSNGVMFFLMGIGQTSTAVLAMLDDGESVTIALQDLFESGGLSARCCGSAEQFLNSTARHDVSCLITDVG